jgi:predicted enzyme related to lactoylglutathione lyase
MNQTGTSMKQEKSEATATRVAMNLEVHVIPVSDVDRSKQFYQLLGWRLDEDVSPAKNVRVVQFTPPGSGCSVNFGNGVTPAVPGSAVAALIVSDIKAAHDEFIRRGIEASAMWHGAPFPPEARLPGPTPSARATGRSSPSVIPTVMRGWSRRSQRAAPVAADTAFASTAQLASVLRRAEAAHGEHEARMERGENWPARSAS